MSEPHHSFLVGYIEAYLTQNKSLASVFLRLQRRPNRRIIRVWHRHSYSLRPVNRLAGYGRDS